jgi:hypothetical protein
LSFRIFLGTGSVAGEEAVRGGIFGGST